MTPSPTALANAAALASLADTQAALALECADPAKAARLRDDARWHRGKAEDWLKPAKFEDEDDA